MNGIYFNGTTISWNAKHGVDIQGGTNIRIVNSTISGNSQKTNATYHGINVAADISYLSISGNRIGNDAGGTYTNDQLHNINLTAGDGDNIIIIGNDLTYPCQSPLGLSI